MRKKSGGFFKKIKGEFFRKFGGGSSRKAEKILLNYHAFFKISDADRDIFLLGGCGGAWISLKNWWRNLNKLEAVNVIFLA